MRKRCFRIAVVACAACMLAVSLSACSSGGGAVSKKVTSVQEYLQTVNDFEEVKASGTGNDVVNLPYPDTPCLIEYSHDEGTFSLVIYDDDSKQVSMPCMHFRYAASGDVTSTWNASGVSSVGGLGTKLQVNSDVPWSLSVKSLKGMEAAEKGKTYTGGRVLYIDDSSLEKLTFSATPTGKSAGSNIMVYVAGVDDGKDVSTITKEYARPLTTDRVPAEGYQSTNAWSKAHSVLFVDYQGDWSVTW